MACNLNYSQIFEMLQKPHLLQKRDKNLNLWYDMICQKMGSKNVDLACTWYSVSVMGPKQGFELGVPALWIQKISAQS